ncbi:hypothetical protein [Roseivivax isoporae]|uniref:Uncharacterized protein n=1 Tax=Roseivivax isoporae LMG 25204 TaxID=1449351 RepID=X7F955_9RHOB|nr:hypothetical protein [Roseivivax isoporae]ETX29340.1 hypothetical protein RISW2_01335 [Roseivivax isoporae LMG 25204]
MEIDEDIAPIRRRVPDPPAAAGWDIVTLRRTGAPPIRFSGRRLFRHAQPVNAGEPLFVELWRMRHGGFVAAHALPLAEGWGAWALRTGSVAEAIAAVEECCLEIAADGRSRGAGGAVPVELDALIDALCLRQQAHERVDDFLLLAGRALADWDAWDMEHDAVASA